MDAWMVNTSSTSTVNNHHIDFIPFGDDKIEKNIDIKMERNRQMCMRNPLGNRNKMKEWAYEKQELGRKSMIGWENSKQER